MSNTEHTTEQRMDAIAEILKTATAEQMAEMYRASFADDSDAARMVRAAILAVYEDVAGEAASESLLDEFLTSRGL